MSYAQRAPLTRCPHCGGSLGRCEKPLTAPQARVYLALLNHISEYGCAPTLAELAQLCGLKSATSVHGHVRRLEAKGWVRRHAWAGRGLQPLVSREAFLAGRAA